MKLLTHISFLTAFLFSSVANAAFMVEQYDNFWNTSASALKTYANNNAASSVGYFDVLDFSDNGDNGDFAGFNLWPSDAPAASGPLDPINQTFFVKVTGWFFIDTTGYYDIRTRNDDGLHLMIDPMYSGGAYEISDPTLHPPQYRNTGFDLLLVGSHFLELYFFENGGGANLEVAISGNKNKTYSLLKSKSIPEPSVIALFSIGLIGLGFAGRRKLRQS